MANTRRVEVFTAGCHICDEVVKTVKDLACPSCEVTVYDLNAKCATGECISKAKQYGIKSVPAVVIDGKLAGCCQSNGPDIEALKRAGLGQAT